MPLYRHPGFSVLRVGPAAAVFLKAYTTHTIDASRSAFLTREGRTIAMVYPVKVSEEEALLAVGTPFAEKLMNHLSKYLAICETKITPVENDAVYFDPSDVGRAIISSKLPQPATLNSEEYTRLRVEQAIPEQGIDFNDEMPLCIDPALVHFDKGCYLGQEIVARVHYRGSPPKKLVVKKQSECSPDEFARMTSKVNLNGDISGFIFVTA